MVMEHKKMDAEVFLVGSAYRLNKLATNEAVSTQILTPRQYQVELLDAALDHNTIVCLQTGSGKMFISVLMIKELSKPLRLPLVEGGKRSVFLVNNAHLVPRQASIIREHTDLVISEFAHGQPDYECLDLAEWKQAFVQSQVLVMAGKTFLSLLKNDFVSPDQINLLIFDECQHATEVHPYSEIMRVLGEWRESSTLPRIMGLTASILHGKCEPQRLEEKLGELEQTLRSLAETCPSGSLSRYSTKPKEAVVVCEMQLGCEHLSEQAGRILGEALAFLEYCQLKRDAALEVSLGFAVQAVSECRLTFEFIGPLGLRIVVPLLLKKLQRIEKHESLPLAKLLLHYTCTQLRLARKICENSIMESENPLDLKFTSPKVRRLVEVLKEFQPSGDSYEDTSTTNPNQGNIKRPEQVAGVTNSRKMHNARFSRSRLPSLCTYDEDGNDSNSEGEEDEKEEVADSLSETNMYGIVFVNHGFLATVLDKLVRKLQKKDPELAFIISSSIMSHSQGGLDSSGVTREQQFKKQEEILRRFRRHEINLLFASSTLEEGVDVPKCNLVIRFDAPDHYRSYVQSKGRARAPNSHYVMLVEESRMDTITRELSDFQKIDKILQRKCHQREQQFLDEAEHLQADSLCPPYKPSTEGGDAVKVTMTTAISLVNRYCSKLPSDTFTHLCPKCHTSTVHQNSSVMYQSLIYLPINSPIRDPIQGPPMPKRKLAEMAAALKTCEMLHKAGELDDSLMPVGKDTALLLEDFGYDQEVVEDGQGRPGTTKRRQYYNKEVADCLKECHPYVGQACYLYEIHMSLASPLPDVLNVRDRKLHGPDETTQSFGILTTKTIPKIPGFPVYTRAGEVAISVDLLTSDILVTLDLLDQLQRFHSCIFAEVLRLEKPNLAFDPKKAEASYLIVPLRKCDEQRLCIDWNFLKPVSESSGMLDRPPVLPDYSRNQFVFTHEAFADAVVTPIYRNIDQPQRYYIADILNDLPVTSPFPSDKYEKFIDYYFERYDIQVSNYKQPLLDVDCMSSRLNLLTPRYLNHKGKALPISNTQSKKNYLQKKQYLVPELCYIYPIPASLWRKAVCLPSILYRLNSLLVAEELRVQISWEAGVGMARLPQDEYPFANMTFGWDGLDLQNLTPNKDLVTEREEGEEDINKTDHVGKGTTSVQEGDKEDICITRSQEHTCTPDLEAENELGLGKHIQSTTDSNCQEGTKFEQGAIVPRKCNKDGSETNVITSSVNSVLNPSNRVQPDRVDLNRAVDDTDTSGNSMTENITCNDGRAASYRHDRMCGSDSDAHSNGKTYIGTAGGQCMTDPVSISSSREQRAVKLSVLDDQGHDPASLPGPSPTTLLQSLTMSNSSDGFNLERLEMLGDSFLKQAVTIYLYCTYPRRHEGKLSYMRSKQVSNFNLYRLGKGKAIGQKMQVALFDPAINWLAPGFSVKENVAPDSRPLHQQYQNDGSDVSSDDGDFAIDTWDPSTVDMWDPNTVIEEEASPSDHDLPMMAEGEMDSDFSDDDPNIQYSASSFQTLDPWSFSLEDADNLPGLTYTGRKPDDIGDLPELPYEIHTQHSLSDKNLADSVEAIIGCYLVSCGFRSALIVMSWFGLRVLPQISDSSSDDSNSPANTAEDLNESAAVSPSKPKLRFGHLKQPESPFFRNVSDAETNLASLLVGMEGFERTINYCFKDKAYLVQAFTHASYHYNCVTDCYQRLEFLGDAILDYLITRHLFDHHQDLSPGALTDLRSALVNNTIFASLAVRFGYHKYFKALSPELFHVINNFVTFVKEKKEALGMGSQLKVLDVDGLPSREDESEDIEVPKALGDIFESVAGAVYLDSGMSLDTVWKVYYPLMRPQIEQYAANLPISPVRELLEMEPETARFGPPERTMDGKTRVTVNVVGKGKFKGIGRNYRIAKATAARCALRHLKSHKK